jgi:hypothetical protein
LLGGQKLAGTGAAAEVFQLLKIKKATKEFPFFTTIGLIIDKKVLPEQIFHTTGPHLEVAETT